MCVCVVYMGMVFRMLGTVKQMFLIQGGGKGFRELCTV